MTRSDFEIEPFRFRETQGEQAWEAESRRGPSARTTVPPGAAARGEECPWPTETTAAAATRLVLARSDGLR